MNKDELVELKKIMYKQEDKIDALLEEVIKLREEVRKYSSERVRIMSWVDKLERIARRRNSRLEELGDTPSDIPTIPFRR